MECVIAAALSLPVCVCPYPAYRRVCGGARALASDMWRDRDARRIVLSFRGTSDVLDVLTDVNLLQTSWEARDDGKQSDDPRQVHAGFYSGARAVSRRIKELLVAACARTPGDWEVVVTGHSLGGALATLMACELGDGIDASRVRADVVRLCRCLQI